MKLSTGSIVFDELLGGGMSDSICVYGPAGTGKSTLAMLAAVTNARKGKVLFLDTEGSFRVERAQDFGATIELHNIFVQKINSFSDQHEIIIRLPSLQSTFSLIIIDTIGIHYRTALGDNYKVANTLMAQQLKVCASLAIPVLWTNQVYSTQQKTVQQVGGNFLRDSAMSVIELQHSGVRSAIMHKPVQKKAKFSITTRSVD